MYVYSCRIMTARERIRAKIIYCACCHTYPKLPRDCRDTLVMMFIIYE